MFSDSRASMPDSGFRMEMSGHLIGVKDAGRRTNQRAAHAAPSALMEPKMLAARQNNDSQPVANAPICSRAILHISVQKPVGLAKMFGATGLREARTPPRWASRQITHRDYDIATLRRQGGSPPWMAGSFGPGRPQTIRACLSSNQSTAGREGNSDSRRSRDHGPRAPL